MLDIKVKGLERTIKKFKKMELRARNPKTVMETIAAKAWKSVVHSFRLEKDKDGVPWLEWKDPKTGSRVPVRPYGKGGSKLLQDTGRLRSSIRWKVRKKWVKIFTRVKYAKYHEQPKVDKAKPKKKGIPKRSFMWIPDKTIKSLNIRLATYIKRGK
jgi:phage gpG-like protein